jgi:hypothetical protein
LDKAIAESTYLSAESGNQRPLQIRWNLANQIDLETIKTCCPTGYATFVQHLIAVAKRVRDVNTNPEPER